MDSTKKIRFEKAINAGDLACAKLLVEDVRLADDAEAIACRAFVHHCEKQYQLCISLNHEAEKRGFRFDNPTFVIAWSVAYLKTSQWASAYNVLEQNKFSQVSTTHRALILRLKGLAKLNLHDFSTSLNFFQQSLRLEFSCDAVEGCAKSFVKLDENERALDLVYKLRNKWMDYPLLSRLYLEVYLKIRGPGELLMAIEHQREFIPSSSIILFSALAHKALANTSEALLWARQGLEISVIKPTCLNLLAAILIEKRQVHEGFKVLKEAVSLGPTYSQARDAGRLFKFAGSTLGVEDLRWLVTAVQDFIPPPREGASDKYRREYWWLRANIENQSASWSFRELYKPESVGLSSSPSAQFTGLKLFDDCAWQFRQASHVSSIKYNSIEPYRFEFRDLTDNCELRIGFFSADFYQHATMVLLKDFLTELGGKRLKIILFSNSNRSDSITNTLKKNFSFIEVAGLSDDKVSDLARAENLDIAVDLKGHTNLNRIKVFCQRVAPVQLTWLGYPSTTGCTCFDYAIVDEVVVTDETRMWYSESLLFLKHSYQVNPYDYPKANRFERKSLGLGENHIIIACFNDISKISEREFSIWMQVLKDNERVQLWLLCDNELTRRNLGRYASSYNVNPQRIVFAGFVEYEEHLERLQCADLFLDTFACNGHTLSSDILRAGVPLITKRGTQFAARVSASLLIALGLPELITESDEEYRLAITRAVENPGLLRNLRSKLAEAKRTSYLFRPDLFAVEFEHSMRVAYRNKKDGNVDDIHMREFLPNLGSANNH